MMKTTKNGDTKDTIKDIVRRGQLLLCDLERSVLSYDFRHKYDKIGKPAHQNWALGGNCGTLVEDSPGLAQSLGELCISMFEKEVRDWRDFEDAFGLNTPFTNDSRFIVYMYKNILLTCSRGDIQQLKQAMWHKHTDPDMEVWERAHDYYSNLWQDTQKTGEIAGKCQETHPGHICPNGPHGPAGDPIGKNIT